MPTVIDSFVAEFTLDPADFASGASNVRLNLKRVREDAGATGKDMEVFGKRASSMLSQVRNEALGLFLAFQGASSVKGFVTDLIAGDAATARLAGNIGMTTNALSAWQLAIQGVGGSATDADGALSAMAQALQSYKLTGTTGHDADLRGLGVQLGDLKDPETALLKIAEAAERMSKVEFNARAQRLGLSPAMITLLEQGRGSLEKLIEAKKRDGAATDDDAAAAQRFQEKLNDFSNHLLGAVRPAVYEVVDVLDRLLTGINDGTTKTPGLTLAMDALTGAAKEVGKTLGTVATALDLLGRAWARLKDMGVGLPPWMKALGTWLDNILNPLTIARRLIDWGDKVAGGPGVDAIAGGKPAPGSPAAKAAGGAGGAPAPGAAGIQAYLQANGLSAAQARGVVAGITAENGSLDPNAVNPTSGAYGIGQWLGPRKNALFAKYGNRPSQKQQLDFLLWELKGGDHGGASVRAQGSAESTMVAYLRDFMRPQGARNEHYADLVSDIKRGYRALGVRGGGAVAAGGGTTNIGTIVVNVAKGDAQKIAAELPGAIKRRKVTTQANRGMS